MDRLRFILGSSIGKKELMALTGLSFIGFLVVHLLGNMSIYAGAESFQSYADKLHSLGPVILVFNTVLLGIGAIHMIFAFTLLLQNWAARPVNYDSKASEGGRTLGSRTMIYTGPLILLFVVFHLLQFTFVDKGDTGIAAIVKTRFMDPTWMGFYAVSMLFVGLHVGHGLWSSLQTLGLETFKRGALRSTSTLVSWIFGLGFGLLPIVVYLAADKIKF